MNIQLNGEPHATSDGVTLARLVESLGRDPQGRGIAVAVDGEVIRRGVWPQTAIQPGQRIEILEAQQGG